MKLTQNDLIIFYDLLHHYNITSPNIAIIGNEKEFKKKMKAIIKANKDYDVLYQTKTKPLKCTIIKNDIEKTYIHIEQTDDMKELYFRKFI